ncbi:MAG: hypothetical protein HDR35_00770 [Treponema sp.]|nr:hypothetical protein [Treponema sp.]
MKKGLIFFVIFAMLLSFAIAEDKATTNDSESTAVAEAEEPAIVGTWKLSKYEWTFNADGTGEDQSGDAITWTAVKKGYVIKLKVGRVAAKKIENGKMVTNIGIFTKQ